MLWLRLNHRVTRASLYCEMRLLRVTVNEKWLLLEKLRFPLFTQMSPNPSPLYILPAVSDICSFSFLRKRHISHSDFLKSAVM